MYLIAKVSAKRHMNNNKIKDEDKSEEETTSNPRQKIRIRRSGDRRQ